MTGTHVTYLSSDALTDGVGASQVLPYVERLPLRGIDVTLHSFEKEPAGAALHQRLAAAGVRWVPHPFGRFGAIGGVGRIARGAAALRRADLVHARADLAAASALLARSDPWVWDCRGLFADQRLDLGTLAPGSAEHRALQAIERRSARGSSAIVTLTRAVIPVLDQRHGPGVAAKATVITTCVDTRRFALEPMPAADRIRLLLAGTINRYYDVPAMIRLVAELQRRRPTALVLASPGETSWEAELAPLAPERVTATPEEMPPLVASAHVGLSVCRDDAGVSLVGSMPTKIGEFLATGRPVVVNSRLGDAAAIVDEHRCGVVLGDTGDGGIATAVDTLEALLVDPSLPDRCRAVAELHFDLERAVDRLAEVYRSIS